MKPTKRQQELLDLLQEECAEVIQIISKIRRFGLDQNFENQTNSQRLAQELTDIALLVQMAETMFGMKTYCHAYSAEKVQKLKKYTTLFESDNEVDIESIFDNKLF